VPDLGCREVLACVRVGWFGTVATALLHGVISAARIDAWPMRRISSRVLAPDIAGAEHVA